MNWHLVKDQLTSKQGFTNDSHLQPNPHEAAEPSTLQSGSGVKEHLYLAHFILLILFFPTVTR